MSDTSIGKDFIIQMDRKKVTEIMKTILTSFCLLAKRKLGVNRNGRNAYTHGCVLLDRCPCPRVASYSTAVRYTATYSRLCVLRYCRQYSRERWSSKWTMNSTFHNCEQTVESNKCHWSRALLSGTTSADLELSDVSSINLCFVSIKLEIHDHPSTVGDVQIRKR